MSHPAAEIDFDVVSGWWPDMTNVMTPLGWKNHLFRFNVAFNGTILAEPYPPRKKKHVEPWRGMGAQLGFFPTLVGRPPKGTLDHPEATDARDLDDPAMLPLPDEPRDPYPMRDGRDRRDGDQGWEKNATPLLWTRWRQPFVPSRGDEAKPEMASGLVLRQRIFVRTQEARDVESGIEPIYAWVRLEVNAPPADDEIKFCGFLIQVNSPHLHTSMDAEQNMMLVPRDAAYPRKLRAETIGDGDRPGLLLLEADRDQRELARLAVAPGQAAEIHWFEPNGERKNAWIAVMMEATAGSRVDLLFPMLPTERAAFEKQLSLGWERALEESDADRARRAESAAAFQIPEKPIQAALETSVKMAEIMAERNPVTGEYAPLSGSYSYCLTWGTPTSMNVQMLIDGFGLHAAAAHYLRIFKNHQGEVTPPGTGYEKHPGYFGVPRSVYSGDDWITDHGATLYSISWHALATDDGAFIDEFLPAILRACEFVKYARGMRGHKGIEGVLPPATATDLDPPVQALWNDGWTFKGLAAAARLLKRIGHERADEFLSEAADYRETFIRALRESVRQTPRWTGRDGKSRPIVPYTFQGGDMRHPFYLDTGPMFLVWAGLMDADDEIMEAAVEFFRQGPNLDVYDPEGSWRQMPVLWREVSSCEPCYSWNLFYSQRRGDRARFLEGLYGLFAGGMSRKTWISSETRGGKSDNVFSSYIAAWCARLAVIDDSLEESTLHLMRLTPWAWLREGEPARFERFPTVFGPLNLSFELKDQGRTLEVLYEGRFHHPPEKVILHVPGREGLESVVTNGSRRRAKAGEAIEIG